MVEKNNQKKSEKIELKKNQLIRLNICRNIKNIKKKKEKKSHMLYLYV